MENLLKLCLFLLCCETGFALQCVKCPSYKKGNCVQKSEICNTQHGEMCMIRRTWYATEIHNLQDAETKCMNSCKSEEKTSGYLTIHTYCCNNEDFCNAIDLPIIMT
ncbi:acrosomal protein SP-10-like [Apodemus sylvaticus]|uniref:acrosomal protein SP-10-like n=1 Tax=Apodemus sylvaticus TaxID=10129 RepID=UPI0022443DD8|nr:acrosomal protein SP-10-like [Apodemus sylvaticus]